MSQTTLAFAISQIKFVKLTEIQEFCVASSEYEHLQYKCVKLDTRKVLASV